LINVPQYEIMGLKAGRNDPCPCGSGRKYKKCCLGRDTAAMHGTSPDMGGDEGLRIKLRQAEGRVINGLMEFAWNRLGVPAMDRAWSDFLGKKNLKADSKHLEYNQLFIPWFLTHWHPDSGWWPKELEGTVADAYLNDADNGLDEFNGAFLDCLCGAPFSFHQVREVHAGVSFEARDVFLEESHTILDQSASGTLRPGDIVFARVLPRKGPTIMCGSGSVVLPAERLDVFIDVRKTFKSSFKRMHPDILMAVQEQIRELYFDMAEAARNPVPPKIHNTDGDPFEFVTLTFDLKVPLLEAIEGLQALSLEPLEDILENAEKSPDGTVRKAEVTWAREGNKNFKSWDNTLLGRLRVEPGILVAEVNSRKRADRLVKEISKWLKGRAVLKSTARKTLEEAGKESPRKDRAASRRESEELMRQPEVRSQIAAMMEKHWKHWPDESLPALDGKTPRQAAKTREGRERLEALLFSFERREDYPHADILAPDLDKLRSELGLK